jgi:hypothetical protein
LEQTWNCCQGSNPAKTTLRIDGKTLSDSGSGTP